MNITFNELRKIKDNLPDGSIHRIAREPPHTGQWIAVIILGSIGIRESVTIIISLSNGKF